MRFGEIASLSDKKRKISPQKFGITDKFTGKRHKNYVIVLKVWQGNVPNADKKIGQCSANHAIARKIALHMLHIPYVIEKLVSRENNEKQ